MSTKIDLGTNAAAARNNPLPAKKEKKGVHMVQMSRKEVPRIVGDYNTVDMAEAEDAKIAKMEMWLAKAIGETLVGKYPNRQWGVQIDVLGGIAVVTCPSLSTENGYYIHISNRTPKELAKRALTAAGEILERYGVSRARKFDQDDLETLERNYKGQVVSSDAKPEDL